MKERPMLFNAAMVRAILDGRKTQTIIFFLTPYEKCGLVAGTIGGELCHMQIKKRGELIIKKGIKIVARSSSALREKDTTETGRQLENSVLRTSINTAKKTTSESVSDTPCCESKCCRLMAEYVHVVESRSNCFLKLIMSITTGRLTGKKSEHRQRHCAGGLPRTGSRPTFNFCAQTVTKGKKGTVEYVPTN